MKTKVKAHIRRTNHGRMIVRQHNRLIKRRSRMSDEPLEKRCMWKKVADNDAAKTAVGNSIITLSKDKPCYECSGYHQSCENRYSKPKTVYGVINNDNYQG